MYNKEQIKRIGQLYEETGGNASRAARIMQKDFEGDGLRTSPQDVLRYWKGWNFEIRGRGGNNNPEGRKYINHEPRGSKSQGRVRGGRLHLPSSPKPGVDSWHC